MASEPDPRAQIAAMEAEIRELRAAPAPHDTARIQELEREIDQQWDLARQQEARSDAGEDPSEAHLRSQSEVEGYLQ